MTSSTRFCHLISAAISSIIVLLVVATCTGVHLVSIADCQAERDIGSRLGVDPTVSAIDEHLTRKIVLGQSKTEVFSLLNKVKQHAVTPVGRLGTVWQVPGSKCYYARFDDSLCGYRLVNRYLCFDRDDRLIFVVHELDLY